MNIVNSKSSLLNNSFTFNNQDKICNCLECYRFADTKVSLKIGKKSITILVCEDCIHKFKES
jgi:hypothetical protein